MSNAAKRVARGQKLTLLSGGRDENTSNSNTSIQEDTNSDIRVEDRGPHTPTLRRNSWGLTEKQTRFARNVAADMTLRQAYRLAFEAKPSTPDQQIDMRAQRLSKREAVRDLVAAYKAEQRRVASHVEPDLRTFVLNGLMREAEKGDTSGARIRAMELLGKVTEVGMFTEQTKQDVSVRRTEDEVKSELIQRLSKLSEG